MRRSAIWQATHDRLVAALPELAGRVHKARFARFDEDEIPAAVVFVFSDSGQNESGSAPLFVNRSEISIELFASGANDDAAAEAINDLVESVEDALLKSAAWVALFRQVTDIGVDFAMDAEASFRLFTASLRLTVEHTQAFDPDIDDGDDLEHVRLQVGAATADVDLTE